ncbi:MAG: 3-dehydroquinate synthase [Hydrotalea sp.]|nr:3-dehydroquinate synthase [Hydrotalea sp.]
MSYSLNKPITIPLRFGTHAYHVVVGHGLLANLVDYIDREKIKGATLPLVIDVGLTNHYGEKIKDDIANNFPDKTIVQLLVTAGEASKSLLRYADLSEKLLACGLERQSWLLAVGGGVVGDLAGFCAATLLRGINFIQVPTTLLAMVDSSVGGKTGINSNMGKNLIGAFHQPSLVLADIDFLKTLPQAEVSAGIAEIIKYGAIMSEDFFQWLEVNMEKLVALDPATVSHAIEQSVKMKAEVVMQDEKESSRRMLLNFGHTFAHAIEAEYQYKRLWEDGVLHGQAVAVGMMLAARFSESLGKTNDKTNNISARLEKLLQRAKLPTKLSDLPAYEWSVDAMLAHMQHDKKVSNQQLVFILLKSLGEATIDKTIPLPAVQDFLSSVIK